MTPIIAKRRILHDPEQSPSMSFKRQKVTQEESDLHGSVGATELASAFALASLASMSPTGNKADNTIIECRDADHLEETIAPVSPDEQRSPVRAVVKKVSFSTDTKDTSRTTSRKLSVPPRIKQQGQKPPKGSMNGPVPQRPHNSLRAPWIHHHQRSIMQHHHHHQNHHNHHSMNNFMRAPPMIPPLAHPNPPPTDKWICDYCNIAAFDTYEEACMHEDNCRLRMQQHDPRRSSPPVVSWPHQHHTRVPPPPPGGPMFQQHQSMVQIPTLIHSPSMDRVPSSESQSWYQGCTSLAVPESDPDWLSALNCFIRDRCVEAFSATPDDVSKNTKRGRIAIDQVGIRCCFCKYRAKEDLQVAAVSFPVSVAGIYESVKRWQKVHVELCEDIPKEVKAKLDDLSAGNSWVPTTRQYWADSARLVGMVDTQDGIRFSGDFRSMTVSPPTINYQRNHCDNTSREPPQDNKPQSNEGTNEGNGISTLKDGDNIVHADDISMVPPYVYFLMRQVEATHFTEADRFVARSKGPIGYCGFQCRHCHGHAGLGKYFPVSSKSLSTNSTSQNIHSHLLKCRKVSPYIKDQLIALKEEKSKAPRLEPGWRRVFFEKIWQRLHG